MGATTFDLIAIQSDATGYAGTFRALIGAGTSNFNGSYGSLSGIPSSFTPSAHSHVIADTTGLQAALNASVVGPASATDNAIARFDTTTGKLIQNSLVTVEDTGATKITATTATGIIPALWVSDNNNSTGSASYFEWRLAPVNGKVKSFSVDVNGLCFYRMNDTGTAYVDLIPDLSINNSGRVLVNKVADNGADFQVLGTASFDPTAGHSVRIGVPNSSYAPGFTGGNVIMFDSTTYLSTKGVIGIANDSSIRFASSLGSSVSVGLSSNLISTNNSFPNKSLGQQFSSRNHTDTADAPITASNGTFSGAVSAVSLTGGLIAVAYTFATVPSASANTGLTIRITDRSHRLATSDGTNWNWTGTTTAIS